MGKERFLVKSFGDNIEGTRIGLAKLLELLAHHQHAVIVVPTIGQVKGTLLEKVLGEKLSKKLINDRVLDLDDGKKISLCGHATLKNYSNADVYLVLWGTKLMIADIEKLLGWKAVVLVTWLKADCEEWEKSYPVQVIYDDKKG
ncbi:hypothetical protein [Rheinheimera sp.]|uniref:hypothetical protein n=1 Tax=Rheinheimera sp. TaxID=1869214 RepID=UPI003AF796AE